MARQIARVEYMRRLPANDNAERPMLWQLMLRTFDTLATDPRDRVYALLSLAHDGNAIVPFPDYSKPAADILRDVSRYMIVEQGQTALILLGGEPGEPQKPSWVPCWSIPGKRAPGWVEASCYLGHRPPYRGSVDIENTLQVRGRYVSSIISDNVFQDPSPVEDHDVERSYNEANLNAIWTALTIAICSLDSTLDPESAIDMLAADLSMPSDPSSELRHWYKKHRHQKVLNVPLHLLVKARADRLNLLSLYSPPVCSLGDRSQIRYQAIERLKTNFGDIEEHGLKFVTVRTISDTIDQIRLASQAAQTGDFVVELENCEQAYAILRVIDPGRYVVIGSMPKGMEGIQENEASKAPWTTLTLV